MLKQISLFLIVFVFTTIIGYGQSTRKKYLGTYSGTISSYTILSGEELINVEPSILNITFLEGNKVQETIGSTKIEGIYRITSDDKITYTIQVNYPNQLVYEELILTKKDKSILRKGFYPQPECKLIKL